MLLRNIVAAKVIDRNPTWRIGRILGLISVKSTLIYSVNIIPIEININQEVTNGRGSLSFIIAINTEYHVENHKQEK